MESTNTAISKASLPPPVSCRRWSARLPGRIGADPRVVHREDGSWLFDGMVALGEVKQALRLAHLPGEDTDFRTLGGYLMARLGKSADGRRPGYR